MQITNSAVEDSYPLTLLTYVLFHEFYFVSGNEKGCERVAAMVQVLSTSNSSSGTGAGIVELILPRNLAGFL
jgi:hypothetical protein